MTSHPIEAESYRILTSRLDLTHLDPGPRAVVARIVHASADLSFAESVRVTTEAVNAGVAAMDAGATVIVDVEMVAAGITGMATTCLLDEAVAGPGGFPTRSAAAMRLAVERHADGAVFVIGCAPTALVELIDLAAAGRVRPALVIGLPVGFVGAVEAKEAAHRSPLLTITNVGEKGGSAVAAAALNAIARLAAGG
jgi:precorrin isomerase